MLDFDLQKIQIFLLMFFRICGMFSLMPIFGSDMIDNKLKYAFCLLFTFVLFPFLSQGLTVVAYNNLILFCILVVREFMIGIVISFIATIIFVAVRFGGEQIGIQIGLNMATIYDPMLDMETNVLVQFQYIIAVFIFLIINGHHLLLISIQKSFELIPIGSFVYNEYINEKIIDYLSYVFIYGIKFCAPVLIMVIVTTVILGLMAKTAPEINILLVGFPLKLFLGFMSISLSIPLLSYILKKFFIQMDNEILLVMKSIVG